MATVIRPTSISYIFLFVALVGLFMASIVNTQTQSSDTTTTASAAETFACRHTYKIPATRRGCFEYRVQSGDTCQSIQDKFRTNHHNVRSVVGNHICTDETATTAGTRRRSPPPPLTENDVFRICPSHSCIYHKLRYGLTCGELATRHHTHHGNIHYTNASAPNKMVACIDPDNQQIPKGSRVQVCQHESMDHGEILSNTYNTTFDDCRTQCDVRDRCSHILFGNGVCKQMSSSTPLMNIASSARNTDAYRCAAEPELQYAGATPNEVGTYFSDDSQMAPCKWLGSSGSDRQSRCIPPHTSATVSKTDACQKKRHCPWESIVASQSEMMTRQKEYPQTDDFLAEVCQS